MRPSYPGLFVVFEGGEGSGKSTQARLLAPRLASKGLPVFLTYEPGHSILGAELRKILLENDREPFSKRAEALIFAADKAEHVENVILPELQRGSIVVCDRYVASTIAYQSYGDSLPEEGIRSISEFAVGGLTPDITFFIDIDPAVGLYRASQVKKTRFEYKNVEYHDRVRLGFTNQQDSSWVRIEATDPIEVINQTVIDHVIKAYEDKKSGVKKLSSAELMSILDKVDIWSLRTGDPCPGCKMPLEVLEYAQGGGEVFCENENHPRLFITF